MRIVIGQSFQAWNGILQLISIFIIHFFTIHCCVQLYNFENVWWEYPVFAMLGQRLDYPWFFR